MSLHERQVELLERLEEPCPVGHAQLEEESPRLPCQIVAHQLAWYLMR